MDVCPWNTASETDGRDRTSMLPSRDETIMSQVDDAQLRSVHLLWLERDSSSALQLVRSMDVPRRLQHIEIRLHWLREQMRDGLLKLRHRSGVENPAECLSARAFFKHRYALGIVVPDGLTAELAELRELCVLQQVLTQGSSIAIVELCCSEHLNLRKVCEVSKVPYIGVHSC